MKFHSTIETYFTKTLAVLNASVLQKYVYVMKNL